MTQYAVVAHDYPDPDALDAWLETEPYLTGRVWEHIEIREVKLFDPDA